MGWSKRLEYDETCSILCNTCAAASHLHHYNIFYHPHQVQVIMGRHLKFTINNSASPKLENGCIHILLGEPKGYHISNALFCCHWIFLCHGACGMSSAKHWRKWKTYILSTSCSHSCLRNWKSHRGSSKSGMERGEKGKDILSLK